MGVRLDDLRCEQSPSTVRYYGGWTIKRTPSTTRPTALLVISDVYLGFRTHWWNNRTTPCLRSNCPGCAKGHRADWHGYVLCLFGREEEPVLFEFTIAAKASVDALIEEHGTLRGLVLSVSRAKETKSGNGRVIISAKRKMKLEDAAKPLQPDQPIFPILCGIWGLVVDDEPQEGTTQQQDQEVRKSKRERSRLAKMADGIFGRDLFNSSTPEPVGSNGCTGKEGS